MKVDRSSELTLFIAGLGTGIALALLFAPVSGPATRSLIGRKATDGGDWVKETVAGLRDRAKEAADEIGLS